MSRSPLFLISFLFCSLSLYAESIRAVVVRGDVRALFKNQSIYQVESEDILLLPVMIKTSERSFVKFFYDDGTTLTVGPKSLLEVTPKTNENIPMIKMISGQIRANVRKATNSDMKSTLIITTPSAALGVRGTLFDVFVNDKNETELIVTEGRVKSRYIEVKDDWYNNQRSSDEVDRYLDDGGVVVYPGEYWSSQDDFIIKYPDDLQRENDFKINYLKYRRPISSGILLRSDEIAKKARQKGEELGNRYYQKMREETEDLKNQLMILSKE